MKFLRQHPFPLLLYVEWIVLAIALLGIFAPARPTALLRFPPPPLERPADLDEERPSRTLQPRFSLRQRRRALRRLQKRRSRPIRRGQVFACILILGLSGLHLPVKGWQRFPYVALGFGLCWLALFAAGGRGGTFFPALLLIVTMRACIISGWPGRIPAAIAAYASFLTTVIAGFSAAQRRALGRSAAFASEIEPTLFNLALNVALLYAFVLAFVLFLVSALLAERRSQQELARANQRLRDYACLAEDRATLQERNRIARELHDSIGHHLTAQSIQLENVALSLADAPEDRDRAAAHLETARQLGKAALGDIRRSVATLRARAGVVELPEPLAVALEKLLQAAAGGDRYALVREIALPQEPPPAIAIAIYRVVQEALTNIAKHADASQIELRLGSGDGKIQLAIADNGCGFDPNENSTGFGLQSMRERVAALGGRFNIHSQPGCGCQIVVEIPSKLSTETSTEISDAPHPPPVS